MNTESALLHALAQEWRQLNFTHFHDAMRPPVMGLSNSTSHFGRWVASLRLIELSRAMVLEQPWPVVREVLRHEMAHQYVFEVLGVRDESAHGPAFQRVCERVGIDPTSRGLPQASGADPEQVRILRKVQRLLALAESDNPHESEAAMARAHSLMRKHNLESLNQGTARRFTYRQLGPALSRVSGHDSILASLISKHFFVQVVMVSVYLPVEGRKGSAFEISGTPENVDMAEYAYAFVKRAAERAWQARPEISGRLKSRFLSGVMMGFLEKLDAQAKSCEQEEGLVWSGDPALRDWFERRYPRLVKGRKVTVAADEAWASGHEAGKEIVLHKGVGAGPDGADPRASGRLLGREP